MGSKGGPCSTKRHRQVLVQNVFGKAWLKLLLCDFSRCIGTAFESLVALGIDLGSGYLFETRPRHISSIHYFKSPTSYIPCKF